MGSWGSGNLYGGTLNWNGQNYSVQHQQDGSLRLVPVDERAREEELELERERYRQTVARMREQRRIRAEQYAAEEKRLSEIEQISEGGMLVNNFKLGCDPEFVMLTANGDFVSATPFGNAREDCVGYDHGGAVAEVRPKPARGAYMLTKNLQRLIQRAGEAAQNWVHVPEKFRAGAYVSLRGERNHVSLGGHIHFGVEPYDSTGRVLPKHWEQINALDHLTSRLEALDILPRKECSDRRTKTQYGRLGDVRYKSYTNPAYVEDEEESIFQTSRRRMSKKTLHRFEYRAMPSWLFDPKVAFTCLTTGKLAVLEPELALETLGKTHNFAALKRWVEGFKAKDVNAKRLAEMLDKGIKGVQGDPDVDFRSRWEVLGF